MIVMIIKIQGTRLDVFEMSSIALMIKCLVAFSQKNSVLIRYFTNVVELS